MSDEASGNPEELVAPDRINVPTQDSLVKVRAMQPTAPEGKLCKLSGYATLPPTALSLVVKALIKRQASEPSADDLFNQGKTVASGPGSWSYPNQLTAYGESGVPAANNNFLYVGHYITTAGGGTKPVLDVLLSRSFKGQNSMNCD